ncbi:variant erythrocyte surface antigen-1 family protein [Babesia divergens]|uniref:Variant erythrocyte surface antigen-1 family protein n=1 Tax=Babesia divergens TaxID=32595 RepID=A0AAD9GB41_BABDI|nr:variant erythrocyte surface antigen-1 family protein [Babesia divergens]
MSIIIVAILESQSALGLYFIGLFLVYSFHCLSLHCKVRMFFIPSCCPGCRIIVSLSVLGTLRSVLTGSLEPLRGTLKVCCMHYTDVFVGHNNIDKLNNALNVELKESGLKTVDLDQLEALASGLGFLAGLPACLCKPKKSVEEGLGKIYEELKINISLISCSNSKLNCDSCKSNPYPCKCCVIQCIKEVKGCPCLKNPKQKCHCAGKKVSCSKVLAGLEACLHLQCLQSDMNEICECKADGNCCKTGQCIQASGGKSCDFCENLKTKTPVPTTGLGLSPPNPIRLAKRLDTFFGSGGQPKNSCGCKCGTPGSSQNKSCCCLACESTDQCVQACSCKGSGKCPCASKTSQCPCKEFCSKINSIQVSSGSSLMKCCNEGKSCHCQVDDPKTCTGQNCCNQNKKVKCLIRRLVLYFKDLQPLSSPQIINFKNCCEFLCVLKTCEFLRSFYNDKRNLNECKECKKGGKGCPQKGQCCAGSSPDCSTKGQDPCKSCSECQQICDSKKFYRELETLRLGGPCGQELWRTLDDFIYFICYVFYPRVQPLENTIKTARNSCSQCKNSSGHSSCPCSTNPSGSSCLGCTEVLEKLQTHKDLLSLMTRGYSSAYSEASWNSLTSSSSGSKCCSLPSCTCQPNCSSSGSLCPDPSKCCPDCPQRKAAKIFLGMLPCLYYGLKILKEKCEVDWKDFLISNKDYSLRHFLVGMGFELQKLDGTKQGSEIFTLLESLFNGSNGPLKSLYEKSKKYFTSSSHSLVPSSTSSDSKPKPKTVREILLWLSGLPFTSGFEALLKHCKGLCDSIKDSKNSVQFNDFKTYLFDSCFLSPFVLGVIEGSKSNEEALKDFPPYKSEISKFSYPEDHFKLFETFCDFVREIYIPLTFLKFQCERTPAQAGWRDCYFGKSCQTTGTFTSSSGCSCPNSDTYLCTNSHSSCSGSSSSSCNAQCPHPLQRFLCDGSSESQSQDSSPFRLPFSFARLDFSQTPPVILEASSDKFLTMGFKDLPKKARQGNSIAPILNSFCGSKTSPLTKLFDFSLFVAMRPPETLIELIAFFLQFRFSGFLDAFSQYASMEPGTPDGAALQNALVNLFKHSSHSADLQSLYACDGPKGSNATCGRYLFFLYNINGVFTKEFCAVYLSWVCHLGKALKLLLEKFHEEASTKFKCCLESSCPSIVKCHCALPFLYSWGFSFYQPENLNCPGHENHTSGQDGCILKSCKDFIAQLKLVAEGDPFKTLIAEIDNFLWSIRKPFFLFILAFWAFVISYFLYVQLYKLDLLHLKSHAHFSRSFKILPSTLFSDASSKLKDLSYFTL